MVTRAATERIARTGRGGARIFHGCRPLCGTGTGVVLIVGKGERFAVGGSIDERNFLLG